MRWWSDFSINRELTRTKIGDVEELKAIDQVFSAGRTEPVLIGSVKSNMGHSEAASGMCSLAKACIAYNSGCIPPNLHYETPRQQILGLVEGRLRVVSDKRPWRRGRYAINNFGFGGANAHVLLEKYARTKVNNGLPADDLPRLVCVSGRTSSAVDKILNDLESKPIDVEVVRLWHAVHATRILNHSHRGYVLLGNGFSKSIPLHRHSRRSGRARRPVWFVYSGMGNQWSRVANHLKALTVFSNSIAKSRDALKFKGIDLLDIVYSNKTTSVGALASCFVGAVAVQIGLTDVLRSVGVEPDYIVGEGVGQLACAYADGCLTAAQAILCAYCCAVSFNEATTVKGSMAIVSQGIKKIKELCPVELEVVCHDEVSCSVVAGPAAAVQDFVNRLTAQGIAVKQINSADVALHSRYVTDTSATLLKHLEEVIPDAKGPTDRWLSTSLPQNLMNNSIFAKASPAYFANSLQSPVLFEEISKLMGGEEAITVQMADQGVLREVLKQSHLGPVNIELSQVDSNDNIQVLLNALGSLYIAGVDLDLANLYPEVEFPVSQETPMISHLVEWEHGENWECDLFKSRGKLTTGERTVSVRIKDESNEFLTGHYIDGRLLYPGSGYLVLVWETLALMREQVFSAMSVVFEDVRFHRFTTIPEQNLEFTINIHELSGEFELSENGSTVVTGRIRAEDNPGEEFVELPLPLEDSGFLRMSAKDFYKELKLRGYQYSGQFRGVVECNVEATRSRVSWNDNWVAFLDNVMQIAMLAADTRNLQLPTFIDRLVFDVDLHYAEIAKLNAEEAREKFIDVCYNHDLDIIRCGGVEVCGVQKAQILKKPSTVGPPAVQRYKFIPNFPEHAMQLQDVINQHVQLVLENVKSLRIRCVELVDEEYSKHCYLPVIENIKCALDVQPHVQSHLFIVSDQPVKVPPEIKVEKNKEAVENTLLYVGADLLRRNDELRQCAAMLKNEGFILSRERVLPESDVDHDCCTIVSACKTGSEVLVLLRPKYEVSIGRCIKIELEDDSYSWMDDVKKYVDAGEKIILYAQNDSYSGILGLVNCLKKEIGGNLIQCYVITGESAPEFDPEDSFYKPRINKDLMMNVFQNNQWGSYCHLLILDLDKTAPVAHAYVNVQTVGDLSSLRWVQGSLGSHIPENRDSEILNVMCSALNFRDVMTATGRLQADEVVRGRVNQDCVQGVEVCGRTANGSRVAAMARRGISNMVSLQNALVCAIPDEWSYEEGATVLVAYVTVYYAMIVIGKMKPGESILIHAGTGGVGQAAISLALHHGCEVFTTVGSPAKRALIKRLFPSLKDSHIGNSRDVSFEEMVTRETRGKGVDLVLNSLAEEKLV
ncbi:fatty acid synthase-like, partial [Battus philenor]|uniref:fatty acid synthase-like n=1 Tax=Battus philenor TaxID=42288 RepID=UPI0035D0DB42